MGTSLMAFLIFIFIVFMSNVGLDLHKDAVHSLSLIYELNTAKKQAEQLARTDVLTGLNNRRAFFELGNVILKNSLRHGHALSVVMLDIDKFKQINDKYGHAVGDEIIKFVANTLNQRKRESDITGRLGGEEFAIIFQETNITQVLELTEQLREKVQQISVAFENLEINTTASFGIAQLDPECNTLDKLLAKADYALYQAKEEGRNRVIIYEGDRM